MPAAIRIPVVASMDASWDRVFSKVEASARRARKVVATEADASAKEEARAWAAAERDLARMEREKVAEVKKSAKDRVTAEKDAQREIEQEAKRAGREREKTERDTVKGIIAANREAEREVKKSEAARGRMVGRGVSAVAGAGARAIGFGASVAGDLARGAGVQLDAGTHFKNAVDLETSATQLSNQGFQEGKAPRVDPKLLMAQAQKTGNETGFSANDIISAQAAFVALTGDLGTSQSLMGDLGKLSKATGTDIVDMAAAAGNVSNALGDVPDKAAKTADIMKTIAGQGKLGAVEIKDLATGMAKVATAASQFEGKDSIKTFGAFAQLARGTGGAASAPETATAMQAFAGTFSKNARLGHFKEMGINVEGAGGKLRDPMEIIIESLQKTKGDRGKMGSLFMSSEAQKVTRPFQTTYQNTYASTEGDEQAKMAAATAAVRKQFEDMASAGMGEKEIQDSFAATMSTSAAKAQVFNNQLDELAADTKNDLIPTLQELAPLIKNDLVPAVKAVVNTMAWFSHTNNENSADVEGANAKAKDAMKGKDPQAMAAAEADLQAAADRQGEDKTGTAHHAIKGAISAEVAGLTGEGGLSGFLKAVLLAPMVMGGGAGAEVKKGAAEDDRSIKAQQEANATLKEIHAAILAQKGKAPPAGDASPTIPAVVVR